MAINDVYKEIQKVSNEIDKDLAMKESRGAIKDSIVVALVSIARQHYLTIFTLVQNYNYHSSAFALVRPLIDATYRAIWLMKVATDNQVERIHNGKSDFSSTMILSKKIDSKFQELKETEDKVFDIFHSRYYANSRILHDMTHGGAVLINKQLKNALIYPSFEEEDFKALLEEARINYGLLLLIYGHFNENEELVLSSQRLLDFRLIEVFDK